MVVINKELFQQRHQTDRQVNNRKSQVLRKGYLVEEKWHRVQVLMSTLFQFSKMNMPIHADTNASTKKYKIQVGDVIRMENNSFIAADILLLSRWIFTQTSRKVSTYLPDYEFMTYNMGILNIISLHLLQSQPQRPVLH